MPRPKTISDAEILKIARRCFEQHGHSIPTREIAKQVGISQSVLYQRFGGKEEMFLRAMMPEPPDVGALLERPPHLSTKEYIELLLHRLVTYFRTLMPSLLHLLTYPHVDVTLIEGAHEHLEASHLRQALTLRLETMREEGELAAHSSGETLAHILLGLAHTTGMHATMFNNPSALDQSDSSPFELRASIDLLWQGVEPS